MASRYVRAYQWVVGQEAALSHGELLQTGDSGRAYITLHNRPPFTKGQIYHTIMEGAAQGHPPTTTVTIPLSSPIPPTIFLPSSTSPFLLPSSFNFIIQAVAAARDEGYCYQGRAGQNADPIQLIGSCF